MKIIKTDDISKIDDQAVNRHYNSNEKKEVEIKSEKPIAKSMPAPINRSGFMGRMGELVRKAIDCCLE